MNDIDVTKVKASGPWVLVRVEALPKVTKGGLYLPDGNLFERLGHVSAVVVSAGKGCWEKIPGKSREVFVPMEVKPGDRVVFRVHLQDANSMGGFVAMGHKHCFMHVRDLVGILTDDAELGGALPYDN
jgi:co-chaperonin GroES (HSP10)